MPSETWYEDDPAEDEIGYPIREYDVTASPNDFNIITIFNFIESGVVQIPGFQRHYVWDIKRASRLIESLIIGIPIPQVFLFEEGRNKFLVVDGQQRLMSIYYFMKMRFPHMSKRTELRRVLVKSATVPEKLLYDENYFGGFDLDLPTDPGSPANPLDGLNYNTLGDYKGSFDLRTIRNVIVKQNAPKDDDSSIYELFNRLNSGGMNLWPQEIRASLYHSPFYTMLNESNLDPRWRSLIGLPDPDIHMKDTEFLLRGLALLVEGGKYAPSMVKFLNGFSNRSKSLPASKVKYIQSLIDSFLDACSTLDKRAFHGQSGKFTISIFDAVFAAVCANPFKRRKLVRGKLAAADIKKVKEDTEFFAASQSRTTGVGNVRDRIRIAKGILAK